MPVVMEPVPVATANTPAESPTPGPSVASGSTVAGSASTPQGSGVVASEKNGLPAFRVYFDVGKANVSSDFAGAAGSIKSYLSEHPTATLAVAGYNDPSGNAAANAALSKRRAQQVSAALVKLGVPATSISLERPSSATYAGASAAESRRVEVNIKP